MTQPSHTSAVPPTEQSAARHADFTPTCLDCKYNLVGLPDGQCPECGLPFREFDLYKAWVDLQARRLQKADLARAVYSGLLFACCVLAILGSTIADLLSLAITLAALRKFVKDRPSLKMEFGASTIVWIVPCLIILLAGIGHAYPPVSISAAALSGLIVAAVALRLAPLASSIILLLGVALPTLFFGLAMLIDARACRSAGHGWTDFDLPREGAWRPVLTSVALQTAPGLIAASLAFAVLMLFYMRRTRVRLKARSKAPQPTPTSPATSPTSPPPLPAGPD